MTDRYQPQPFEPARDRERDGDLRRDRLPVNENDERWLPSFDWERNNRDEQWQQYSDLRGGRSDYDGGPGNSSDMDASKSSAEYESYGDPGWAGRGNGHTKQPGPNYEGRDPKGYPRSDERIKEDVCERLAADPRVDASEVSVEVQNGNVAVAGSVPERSMKHAIEQVIEECSGVKDIENSVHVSRNAGCTGSTINRDKAK